jgi:hypothetical protein
MDFVTVTDHNTLAGSLAIAHMPGTFLSCEFDTWFPKDGVKVHVVALGIDEATFAAADRVRESIFDLVACLRGAGVVHYLGHPLYDMTGRLTADHVEQLLLLFNTLEGRNGSRVDYSNVVLEEIASSLTPADIERMAERHGIEPLGETPWRKGLTGGSDDHSGLFVAGAHTVAGGDGTVEGFLAAIARGECAPAGAHGDGRLLAHAIYAGSFNRLREITRLDEAEPRRRLVRFFGKGFDGIGTDMPFLAKAISGVRVLAPGLYRDGDRRGPEWEALVEREIGALLATPEGLDGVSSSELNRRLFTCIQRLGDAVARHHLGALMQPAMRLSARRKLEAAFGVGAVHFLEIPYFIAWAVQTRDRAVQYEMRRYFLGSPRGAGKLVLITDAERMDEGEAAATRALSERARERGVTIETLTVSPRPQDDGDGVVSLEALAVRPQRAGRRYAGAIPSAVQLYDYLEQQDFTAVHVTTTGALGLAGALAGKLLHLPVTGYVATGAVRRPLLYRLMSEVFVPDEGLAARLVAQGVDPGRIRVLPDGPRQDRLDAYHAAILEAALQKPPRPTLSGRPRLRRAAARAAVAVQEQA